jgi:magnesium-transporting ATPase (P-type)
MSLVPGEFPVVLAVFLALVRRIAQQHVLTRRAPAVGPGRRPCCASTKPGTLTQNRMAVRRLSATGGPWTWSTTPSDYPNGPTRARRRPGQFGERVTRWSRPSMPRVASAAAHHLRLGTRPRAIRLRALLAVVHVWKAPSDSRYIVAAKEAPRNHADLCHLDRQARERLLGRVALASDGLCWQWHMPAQTITRC